MKLCKDCKHFRKNPNINIIDLGYCTRTIKTERKKSLITGETITEETVRFAENERSFSDLSHFDKFINRLLGTNYPVYCGPEGKFWEVKDEKE